MRSPGKVGSSEWEPGHLPSPRRSKKHGHSTSPHRSENLEKPSLTRIPHTIPLEPPSTPSLNCMKAWSLARADPLVGLRYAPEGLTLLFGLQSDGEGGVLQNGHPLWGIWGSYYNSPKAIFYLLKGDYIRGLLYGDSCEGPHNVNVFLEGGIYNHAGIPGKPPLQYAT